VPGDGLGHVAGARRPEAGRELVGVGKRERVSGAAQLERADRLQVLELQVDLRRPVVLQPDERRPDDGPGYAAAR
jgi:hypothetical protein